MKHIPSISGSLLATLVAGGLAFSASAAIDISKLPPPSDKTGLTYANDIQPLFKASCVRCHGQQRSRGGIHLDTLDGVLKGGDDGPILKVGDSAHSQLVAAISRLDPKSAMPPKQRNRPPGGPGGPGAPGGPPPGGPGGDAHPAGAPGDGGPGPGAGGPPPGGPEGMGGPGGPGGTNGPAGGPPRRPQGPPPKPLTAEEVGLVRAWIDQGAH